MRCLPAIRRLTGGLINRIDAELDDLLLPYTFDLSILADIENAAVLEHIRRVGTAIYEKPAATSL